MPLIIWFATKGPSKVREEYNWTKCAPHKIFTYAVLLSETPPAAIKNNSLEAIYYQHRGLIRSKIGDINGAVSDFKSVFNFGNENEIFLSFTSSSWIEIYVNNELIEAQQFKAGDTYSRKVQIPFKIVVGNADSLKGTYNGEMIDFSTDNDSLYGVKTVLFDDE